VCPGYLNFIKVYLALAKYYCFHCANEEMVEEEKEETVEQQKEKMVEQKEEVAEEQKAYEQKKWIPSIPLIRFTLIVALDLEQVTTSSCPACCGNITATSNTIQEQVPGIEELWAEAKFDNHEVVDADFKIFPGRWCTYHPVHVKPGDKERFLAALQPMSDASQISAHPCTCS